MAWAGQRSPATASAFPQGGRRRLSASQTWAAQVRATPACMRASLAWPGATASPTMQAVQVPSCPAEIDLRFGNKEAGSMEIVVAPVLRFMEEPPKVGQLLLAWLRCRDDSSLSLMHASRVASRLRTLAAQTG